MSNDSACLAAEQHSIGCVLEAQRYGTPLRLFTIWLGINLSILCLTVDKLGVAASVIAGLTALAVVVGNAIGTIFMAAYSTQRPHVGIPRMVQTRAQLGVLGPALPVLTVVATFALFKTANAIVLREPLKALMPLGNEAVLHVFGLVTLLIAFIAYEFIHRMGALLAVPSAVLFVAATVLLLLKRGFFGAPSSIIFSASGARGAYEHPCTTCLIRDEIECRVAWASRERRF